ncbi:MAG: hypothetical protein KC535_03430 [Nanoarchaeota archaeon]|nr:hypothetical protein [Nanoarchaeota archaeon]
MENLPELGTAIGAGVLYFIHNKYLYHSLKEAVEYQLNQELNEFQRGVPTERIEEIIELETEGMKHQFCTTIFGKLSSSLGISSARDELREQYGIKK